MEAAGPALVHLTKERVAAALALTPAALVTLLRKDLSLSFRQLRRIILMRRAVLALASTNEQVAQIAYALGYDSPIVRDPSCRLPCGAHGAARRVGPSVSRFDAKWSIETGKDFSGAGSFEVVEKDG
jgi:hypothetical protein